MARAVRMLLSSGETPFCYWTVLLVVSGDHLKILAARHRHWPCWIRSEKAIPVFQPPYNGWECWYQAPGGFLGRGGSSSAMCVHHSGERSYPLHAARLAYGHQTSSGGVLYPLRPILSSMLIQFMVLTAKLFFPFDLKHLQLTIKGGPLAFT